MADPQTGGFWDGFFDVALAPLNAIEEVGDTVEGAINTIELVLVLLAIAVILLVVYNPKFLKLNLAGGV